MPFGAARSRPVISAFTRRIYHPIPIKLFRPRTASSPRAVAAFGPASPTLEQSAWSGRFGPRACEMSHWHADHARRSPFSKRWHPFRIEPADRPERDVAEFGPRMFPSARTPAVLAMIRAKPRKSSGLVRTARPGKAALDLVGSRHGAPCRGRRCSTHRPPSPGETRAPSSERLTAAFEREMRRRRRCRWNGRRCAGRFPG